jgi:hypothetical protein
MARCEQTIALTEAEGASVARRSEGEVPGGIGLARLEMWSGSILPAAVVSRFGWHRSRRKGRQSYTLCEREWLTGAAARHGDPASNCVGMPDMFLQCVYVSRGSSTSEQEDLEVREGIGIANQSGPTGFFHESTTSSSS